ncbi:hypothetical protein FACS1894182_01840 [Bacteroidia bacterium]|nr:hypothetical protein FACS1894182_01840 [Bacteroidia bacterium]
MYNITFETKCWENDWEYLLKTNYLDKMIERCNVHFQSKQLIINNVNDHEKVSRYAQEKVDRNIIDAFYFVDDYIEEALKCYDIRKGIIIIRVPNWWACTYQRPNTIYIFQVIRLWPKPVKNNGLLRHII